MTTIALVLFVLAIVLLLIEGFTTGFGAFGVPGLLSLAAAVFITIVTVPHGLFIVLGVLAVIVPLGLFFLRYIRRKQLDGRLVLTEVLADDKNDVSGLEYFAGKEGISQTALRPLGRADFNGANIEVYSKTNYIAQNKRVKVVDVKNNRVYVKEVAEN